MNTLLDALYKEYTSLKEKLDAIGSVIVSYGGSIPGNASNSTSNLRTLGAYSKNFTWKEKINYTLKETNKPMSVIEITDFLVVLEPDINREKIHRAITQASSAMGISEELGVDKTSGINKYFIKP